MLKKYSKLTAVAVIVSGLTFTIPCADALAEPRGGGGYGMGARNVGPARNDRRWVDGSRHYYRNGRWYRHGWFGFDIVVSALTIGALIDSLPPKHNMVVAGGVPYYYYDNYYYRPCPSGGYVVVPAPVTASPVVIMPEASPVSAVPITHYQAQDTFTINIPNIRGGYTAVTLRRTGSGFVGPQGEYYPDTPTVQQLKLLYGK